MNESHSLQHLDIKPENLLLLAGHVKVADFGLVKDMRQSQASLVGGMTPLYASPEVYRGTPSRQSDQYSLAIVYQEMLTGTLPFCGGNAAELTLQHLNDEPNLSALEAMDRYAVSRALSKDPQHRYATCREFVEALFKATTSAPTFDSAAPQERESGRPAVPSPAMPRQCVQTDVFDSGEVADWSTGAQRMLVEMPPADCTVTDLPALQLDASAWKAAPMLILGIGGAAGRVLGHFRKLMHEQLGGKALPAVQLLLLDTDSRSIAGAGFTPDETLNLPLRRPQHYREQSDQLLGWLSRRWLYNIPRTLRTEGLRPLGRLALVDHARQAGQRIRRAMSQAVETESLTASAQAIGRPFRDNALRVYVVASISGGTGSGMALDIGYAVRTLLGKLGVADARICGLMMHSTGGDPRHCELARVNALSWLTEFHHFQQAENAYPGDASCGLPTHPQGVSAFDDTYLVHLGENLNEVDFDQATLSIAEYLRLSTLTPGAEFFEVCRTSDAATTLPSGSVRKLRSMGLFQQAAAPSEICDEFAGLVSQKVIATWRATPADGGDSARAQLVRRLQLDANGIAGNTRSLLELALGGDVASFTSSLFANHGHSAADRLAAIDGVFAAAGAEENSKLERAVHRRPVAESIAPLVDKLRKEVRRWVVAQVDDRKMRFAGVRKSIDWLAEHCAAVKSELNQIRSLVSKNLAEVHRDVLSSSSAAATASMPSAEQQQLTYFCMRVDELALFAAEHVLNSLLCEAKSLSDEMTALGCEIDQVASAVARACGDTSTNGVNRTVASAAGGEVGISRQVQAVVPHIVDEVDARLQTEYIAPQGGLASVVMGGGRPRAQLTAKLHELSRQVVQRVVADIHVAQLNAKSGDATVSDLRCGLSAATPSLLEYGGTRRVLALLPKGGQAENAAAYVAALGTPVTVAENCDNTFALCVEVGGLPIEHIAASLVEYRRDRVEFAGRVHSRTDVSWTPLINTTATPEPIDWSVNTVAMPSMDSSSQVAMSKTVVL
jgi:hypothetical protein